MSREPKLIAPVDQRGLPIQRAMGLPVAEITKYLSGDTNYAILFDFTAEKYQTRVFTGLSVENPSASSRIRLYAVDDLMDTPRLFFDIGPQQFFTMDNLQFGPGIIDDTEEKKLRYILGLITPAQGTLASGTIDYSVSGQPSDEDTVVINGLTYEFSSDQSKATSSDYLVEIGASADASWTNLVNKLNLTQRFVTASINTTTDVVTLTANIGGTTGNAITIADGSTGATFSGATLASGTGGVLGYYHIW